MEHMGKPTKQEITPELVEDLLANAAIEIPEGGVFEKLKSAEQDGRRLTVKMGFDPTSPDLHLGHAVGMRQLKRFQDLGHTPVIIIGDFTGLIGDPSGRNKSRPLVDQEELERNAQTYIDQLGKVIDISDIEVHRNSEWLAGMTLQDVIKLLAQGTLSQVVTRDDFRKRLDAGTPVGLHEIIYPFLQGMDSVAIKADIEIGGVDQLYAFQAARQLQSNSGEDPQASVLMPLLRGLDGKMKMSKSLENYIGLSDEPRDMFGKVMSVPDDLIEEYLKLASGFSRDEIENMLAEMKQGRNPMEIKLALAHDITKTYHGDGQAEDALHFFDNQFRKRGHAREFTSIDIEDQDNVVDLLVALGVKSKAEARRLINQGAVTINGNQINDINEQLDSADGLKVKIGKKRFYETSLKTQK